MGSRRTQGDRTEVNDEQSVQSGTEVNRISPWEELKEKSCSSSKHLPSKRAPGVCKSTEGSGSGIYRIIPFLLKIHLELGEVITDQLDGYLPRGGGG